MKRLAAAALLALSMTVVGHAHADPPPADQARELARRGIELARQGQAGGDQAKLVEAIGLFERAFELDPQPEYQCNIGLAYRDRKLLAHAHLYIGRCVAGTTDSARKQKLRAVQLRIENDLMSAGHSPVNIVTRPAGATVDVDLAGGALRSVAPVQIWLPAGSQVVRANAAGHREARAIVDVEAFSGARSVSLTLEATPPPEPVSRAEPPVASESVPPVTPEVPELAPPAGSAGPVVDGPSGSPGLSWGLLGTGGAFIATGAVFHVLAVRTVDDLEPLPLGATRRDKINTLKKQRSVAVALYAVGAVLAGWGAYRLRTAEEPARSVSLSPVRGGAMMTLRWRR